MSACASTLQPTALKFGTEAIEEGIDNVFLTDLDRDLTPTRDNLPASHQLTFSPSGHINAVAASITAEWKKLKMEGVGGSGWRTKNSPGPEENPSSVCDQRVGGSIVQMQPKPGFSEADVILQPSQVEEMLGQNSYLLNVGERETNAARGSVPTHSKDAKTNSSSSTASCSVHNEMEESLQTSNQNPPHPSPQISRRSSIWDGFMSCLSPVMGVLKKENREIADKDEWEIPFADIRELNFIGSGSQGAVFVGEYLREKVAVKKVTDISYCQDARHLRKLCHPNIVKFRGVCSKPPCYCLILEYCPGGTLYDYIRLDMEILPSQVVCWARQIGGGMLYLHSKKIIHRDLKSLNILLCENNILKIADFGVSRFIGDRSTKMTFVGTVGWMSPEMIRHELCSEKVDVWSYGVLLWELLMQEKPYNNVSSSAVIWGVGSNNLHLPIPTSCPVGLKLLMEMCWQPKPKNRPSFRQILMHLDLAAGAFLTIPPDTYLMTQENWRGEIEQCLSKLRIDGIPNDSELIHQREEELKHAQDVRLMYEQKLQTADKLYKELKSCKNQLDAKELELQRRERQLNDIAYKVKRLSVNGGFPSHIDTPPIDCLSSDSSDNQEDGPTFSHVPPNKIPTLKIDRGVSFEPGTPTGGGGRRRLWRRKRRQSYSKEERPKDSGFLDKIQRTDLMARRDSLPPLNGLSNSPDHATPTHPNNSLSRDSTPKPNPKLDPSTPITPNGSFSPEVSELIESFRRHHKRSGSNGSVKGHKRHGSNGSAQDATPIKGHSNSGSNLNSPYKTQSHFGSNLNSNNIAPSSKRNSMELSSSRRGSNSGIPYSKIDVSDSESNSGLDKVPCSKDPFHALDGDELLDKNRNVFTKRPGVEANVVSKDSIYSNESSIDTHESNEGGSDADGESTSDENRFEQFSGTEPNETTESNIESSAASPSQIESDGLASCSSPDLMESDITSNLIPKLPLGGFKIRNQTVPPDVDITPKLSARSHSHSSYHPLPYDTQNLCKAVLENQYITDGMATPTVPDDTSKNEMTEFVSQFESQEVFTGENIANESTGFTIPLHIRRRVSPERNDETGYLTPTATKPKMSSVTTIVRTFFENMSSKQKTPGMRHQSSTDLEDSGFQSPQAGVVSDVFS